VKKIHLINPCAGHGKATKILDKLRESGTTDEVYVPKSPHEKALQRALIQYRNPKNHALVVEALTKAGRTDLIGFGKECLIRPRITKSEADRQYGKSANGKKIVDGKGSNGKKSADGKNSAGKNGKQIDGKRTKTSSKKNTVKQEGRKSGEGRNNNSRNSSGKKRAKTSEKRGGRVR